MTSSPRGTSGAWLLQAAALLAACGVPHRATRGQSTTNEASTSRTAHCGARIGHRLFVFGGIDNRDGTIASRPAVLDLSTGAWSSCAPQPTPRWFAAAVALEREIVILGGGSEEADFLPSVEEYFTDREEWRDLEPMQTARNRFTAVVLDGDIWVLGGLTEEGNTASVEIRDASSGRWRAGPSLGIARHGHAAAVLEGSIVVIGGYVDDGRAQRISSSVEVLEPGASSWEPGTPLPAARGFPGVAVTSEGLYVLQGRDLSRQPTLRLADPGGAFEVVGDGPPHVRNRYVTACFLDRVWLVGGEGEREGVVVQVFDQEHGWISPSRASRDQE